MTRTPALVVGAILVDDLASPCRVLAAQRAAPAALAGQWEFPGGKVEGNEHPIAALHRELAEELAITVEIGGEFCCPDHTAWPISAGYAMRLWFAAIRPGAEPTLTAAHRALRWLPVDQLGTVPWLDADRRIVAELQSELGAPHPRR